MFKFFIDIEEEPGLTEPRLVFTFYGGDDPEDRERRSGLQAIAQRLAYATDLEVSQEHEDQHTWLYIAGPVDKLMQLAAAALAEAELRWPEAVTWSVGLQTPEDMAMVARRAVAKALPKARVTINGAYVPSDPLRLARELLEDARDMAGGYDGFEERDSLKSLIDDMASMIRDALDLLPQPEL